MVSKLAKTLGNHIEVSFWLELFWAPPPLRLFTWERFLSRPEIKEGKAHSGRECQYKERLHNLIPTICAPQSAQSHLHNLHNLIPTISAICTVSLWADMNKQEQKSQQRGREAAGQRQCLPRIFSLFARHDCQAKLRKLPYTSVLASQVFVNYILPVHPACPICPICPVCPLCPVCHLCPVFPIFPVCLVYPLCPV